MAYKNKKDQAVAARRHYESNKAVIKARATIWKKNQIELLKEISWELRSIACMDCEYTYKPYIMEFDHVRGKKRDSLANMVRNGVSTKTFMEEVAKCEIVCANCHRERTWQRRNNGSAAE